MTATGTKDTAALWASQDRAWRDPLLVASQWGEPAEADPRLLEYAHHGQFWEVLAAQNLTLLITREYEHLAIGLNTADHAPRITYMRLPHPSGLAVDREKGVVHIASTRNPNQVYDLAPATTCSAPAALSRQLLDARPLVPFRARYLPGRTYLHDLALIRADLYANAVGHNAIIRLYDDGHYERVWWPKCIETGSGPDFGKNYLQLNSIAAGDDLTTSYFSASTDKRSARRPGHLNFAVDGRGVIFSGHTREPVVRNLTRPHSARLQSGRIWVDNSGYGEFGAISGGQFEPLVRLPGWTRGLCLYGGIAFVGTSRVLPRFSQYAPGIAADSSVCGIHAVDTVSGKVLGSLIWPYGNQIFGIEWVTTKLTSGFVLRMGARRHERRERELFYGFATGLRSERHSLRTRSA